MYKLTSFFNRLSKKPNLSLTLINYILTFSALYSALPAKLSPSRRLQCGDLYLLIKPAESDRYQPGWSAVSVQVMYVPGKLLSGLPKYCCKKDRAACYLSWHEPDLTTLGWNMSCVRGTLQACRHIICKLNIQQRYKIIQSILEWTEVNKTKETKICCVVSWRIRQTKKIG